jgi:hypothetical protein
MTSLMGSEENMYTYVTSDQITGLLAMCVLVVIIVFLNRKNL